MTTSPQGSGVFLSYKREDQAFVERIHNDLKLRGVESLWIDLKGIRMGEKWSPEIENAILERSHLVLFLSPIALDSNEIRREYEFASELGKKVIPIIIHQVEISALPEIIRSYQIAVDFVRDGYGDSIVKLAKALPRPYILPELSQIPAGEFLMGHPNRQREVYLPEFWMGKRSVSLAEYSCFVRSGGRDEEKFWPKGLTRTELDKSLTSSQVEERDMNSLLRPSQPVKGVSWNEAIAYCNWLSSVTFHKYTLPTEAQWEKAARGTEGRLWPFGNEWNPLSADVKEGKIHRPEPKDCGIEGSASPFGCEDMAGQVWNWTNSVDEILHDNEEIPEDDDLDQLDSPRIIRGGSWKHSYAKAYAYHRESQLPSAEDYPGEVGFRLVTMSEPSKENEDPEYDRHQ